MTHETGNTICILIKTKDYYVILDAGSGIHKIDDFCKKKKPAYLFLSHFHLDHIFGLHILNKIKCFESHCIFLAPVERKRSCRNLSMFRLQCRFLIFLFPLNSMNCPKLAGSLPFSVTVKPLLHSSLTLGYRLKLDRKVISYCPDTGYCQNAVELSKNADLLIAECAYKSGQQSPKWPHLNPGNCCTNCKRGPG